MTRAEHRREFDAMHQNQQTTPSSPGAPGSATFSPWQGEQGLVERLGKICPEIQLRCLDSQ